MWNTIIINPLSNTLHFFYGYFGDIGLAIIFLTILIKVVLFPLNISAARTSKGMKLVQSDVEKLKEKHKKEPQVLGLALNKLYKENNIKPFAGILNLFIQIPILLGLYKIIVHEVKTITDTVTFLNIEISKPSIFLAVLVFVSIYILMQISTKDMQLPVDAKDGFQKEFTKMMQMQMKYFMPVIMFISSVFLPAGITIYLITSNIFGIFQTLLIRYILIKHKTTKTLPNI